MERFAFIHGSSVGQSSFIPSDAEKSICDYISNKFFQGRVLRQKEAASKLCLFVELLKGTKGDCFCVYSFVNNDCLGANNREGQYFAISIVCKDYYIYPESVLRLLEAAYNQMLTTKKIISVNSEGFDKYLIQQFSSESIFLSAFIKQIETFFDNIACESVKKIEQNSHIANYENWVGAKVNTDMCNSMATFKSFCNTGRLYISEEYESSSKKIMLLEDNIETLKKEITNLKQLKEDSKRNAKAKALDEIEGLNSEIKSKNNQIAKLTSENEELKSTIETVRGEVEKYAKIGKSISSIREQKPLYQYKSKFELLKMLLLLLLLILTFFIGLFKYCFFRNITPSLKDSIQENTASAITSPPKESKQPSYDAPETTWLAVSPTEQNINAQGGDLIINVNTDGVWEAPNSPDWINFTKDGSQLICNVQQNDLTTSRTHIFMIRSGTFEKQVKIIQEERSQTAATQTPPDFGLEVRDLADN